MKNNELHKNLLNTRHGIENTSPRALSRGRKKSQPYSPRPLLPSSCLNPSLEYSWVDIQNLESWIVSFGQVFGPLRTSVYEEVELGRIPKVGSNSDVLGVYE